MPLDPFLAKEALPPLPSHTRGTFESHNSTGKPSSGGALSSDTNYTYHYVWINGLPVAFHSLSGSTLFEKPTTTCDSWVFPGEWAPNHQLDGGSSEYRFGSMDHCALNTAGVVQEANRTTACSSTRRTTTAREPPPLLLWDEGRLTPVESSPPQVSRKRQSDPATSPRTEKWMTPPVKRNARYHSLLKQITPVGWTIGRHPPAQRLSVRRRCRQSFSLYHHTYAITEQYARDVRKALADARQAVINNEAEVCLSLFRASLSGSTSSPASSPDDEAMRQRRQEDRRKVAALEERSSQLNDALRRLRLARRAAYLSGGERGIFRRREWITNFSASVANTPPAATNSFNGVLLLPHPEPDHPCYNGVQLEIGHAYQVVKFVGEHVCPGGGGRGGWVVTRPELQAFYASSSVQPPTQSHPQERLHPPHDIHGGSDAENNNSNHITSSTQQRHPEPSVIAAREEKVRAWEDSDAGQMLAAALYQRENPDKTAEDYEIMKMAAAEEDPEPSSPVESASQGHGTQNSYSYYSTSPYSPWSGAPTSQATQESPNYARRCWDVLFSSYLPQPTCST